MATATSLLTIDEYLAMPNLGERNELVLGRIVEVPPPGNRHGLICARFARLIGNHVVELGLGEVMTNDSGIITHRDPDSVRGADIAYYAAAKLPPIEQWTGYFDFPPDLVVEVRSPSDRWSKLVQKAGEYLDAGVLAEIARDHRDQAV